MNQKTLLSRLQNADVIYKKYHIPQAFLVGSFARGEGTSTSDVDIYIPGNMFRDLSTYMHCKFEFEALVGRSVDLITDDTVRREVHPYILDSRILLR